MAGAGAGAGAEGVRSNLQEQRTVVTRKDPVATDEVCRMKAGLSPHDFLHPGPHLCFPCELENTQAPVLLVLCA